MTGPYLPKIIAHRGVKAEAPENTFSAFKKVSKYPISGFEFDIQLTKDGYPVIFHDDTLWKINKSKKRLRSFTLEELNNIDFGTWYHKKFRGEKIPQLKKLIKQFGTKHSMYLEIKLEGRELTKAYIKQLTSEVVKGLDGAPNKKNLKPFTILSFESKSLEYAYSIHPKWNYLLNVNHPKDFNRTLSKNKFLWGIGVNINHLSSEFSNYVHSSNKQLMSYTCNSLNSLNKALKYKVDIIITDDPGWLLKTNEYKGLLSQVRKK